ncbi:MAG: hypothetical protein GTO63_35920 [Anaerolineae bacterium]|nr:hypothetical protein [Anaerolineae bacterium]NIO00139.1 hypothetical protein [Anaerolineae bacterium]NIQ82910.1 hypothetical protein [Anaerolineae bacterium]
MHPLRDIVLTALSTDIEQMAEEGHDAQALLREMQNVRATGSLEALLRFQEDLWNRPSPAGFAYEEPSDWETISRGYPQRQCGGEYSGAEDDLADRLLGAWQGRCVGCQLGKPLENGWPNEVREVLELVGSWPLDDYIRGLSAEQNKRLSAENPVFRRFAGWAYDNDLVRGSFDSVSPDDDIHYTVVNLLVLEEFGIDFTPEQAIAKLVELTPASWVAGSGKNMLSTFLFGLRPPHTALFGNPCRQGLGAQIRCDPWGWVAPGDPALAARMAYKDAASSQVRNGIYSGLFFAALMADVLVHGDLPRAVDTAAGYVPPRSRFAEMIRFVKDQCAQTEAWEEVNEAIYARYDRGLARPKTVKPNHALPNAAIAIMALLLGGGDFTRTLGISVMAGMDTDCNGATVGSIMGCALGGRAIPDHWVRPLNDRVRVELKGMTELSISELARRTHDVARRNLG